MTPAPPSKFRHVLKWIDRCPYRDGECVGRDVTDDTHTHYHLPGPAYVRKIETERGERAEEIYLVTVEGEAACIPEPMAATCANDLANLADAANLLWHTAKGREAARLLHSVLKRADLNPAEWQAVRTLFNGATGDFGLTAREFLRAAGEGQTIQLVQAET
ncbi:MAG TPA: hypothetical protein VG796_17125 [Verrucomicrobiales bacterium]|nr:hypothetical protein [Verrucomicrobiales bacterium]